MKPNLGSAPPSQKSDPSLADQDAVYLDRPKSRYGFDGDLEIRAPKGWRLLPEGADIPQVHRVYGGGSGWCEPRRCHSTMTPIYACVWGYMKAFAVPEAQQDATGE